MTPSQRPHRQEDGITSPNLFFAACPTCTVNTTYRPVRDQWQTFVVHQDGCPHYGEQLTPAGWGRIT